MSSNESSTDVPRRLFIPGRPITEMVVVKTESQSGTLAEEEFKRLKNNCILAPLVQAFLVKHPNLDEDMIKLGVVGFLDTNLGLTIHSFNYHFDLSLNLDGSYQLVVYVFYRQPTEKDEDKNPLNNAGLINFHFDFGINFTKDIVFNTSARSGNDDHTMELGKVKTVKVFIANTNPETSRGTTTTVQSSTGNG